MDTLSPHADNGNIPEKQCTGICGRFLPATTDFFYRNKGCKDGFLPECKSCRSVKDKTYRESHVEEIKGRSKKYCAEHREEREKYNESWRREHRGELRLYASKHYEENRGELLEQQKKYYQENLEEIKLYREKYYEEHSEEIKDRAKRYHQTEQGKIVHLVSSHNRRARVRDAIGKHTSVELKQQFERQHGRCYYCKAKVTWTDHHADHVVPLSRGGTNDIHNIVITCPTCNLKKSKRLPHEFPYGGRLL